MQGSFVNLRMLCGYRFARADLALLHHQRRWNLPRLIPQRQFHPVPQSQLVVNHAQIIFHHVLRGPDFVGDFTVLQALGNELDDSLLAFTGDTAPITSI